MLRPPRCCHGDGDSQRGSAHPAVQTATSKSCLRTGQPLKPAADDHSKGVRPCWRPPLGRTEQETKLWALLNPRLGKPLPAAGGCEQVKNRRGEGWQAGAGEDPSCLSSWWKQNSHQTKTNPLFFPQPISFWHHQQDCKDLKPFPKFQVPHQGLIRDHHAMGEESEESTREARKAQEKRGKHTASPK